MPLTTAQIINIAKVSEYLARVDSARGSLFGQRVSPNAAMILYMERKAVEWMYDHDPTNSTLTLTSNYLYSLCRGYNLQGANIVNGGSGGSVSPITPSTSGDYTSLPVGCTDPPYEGGLVAGESTYQNDLLIGATQLEFILLNNGTLTILMADFTFDSTLGQIQLGNGLTWSVQDRLVIPYRSA